MIRRLWESLFPPLSDFGIPDENGTSLAEYGRIVDRAKVRECMADLPDLVSDADLLALVHASGVPFTDRTVPHEPSAVERGSLGVQP